MINAFFNALSGLKTFSRKFQNSANNVANVSTAGFKAGRVEAVAQRTGGVQAAAASRSNLQGSIQTTSNPLDLAVNGGGFFQVALPNGGTGFTRGGNFKVDNAGRVVTSDGNPILPEIVLPGNRTGVSVGSGGEVSAMVENAQQNVGQLQLANFNNPAGLSAAGGNIFLQTGASGPPITGNPGTGAFGTIISGALEASNVDLAREIVDQIVIKNAFKANAKVIKAADEMTGAILDIKA